MSFSDKGNKRTLEDTGLGKILSISSMVFCLYCIFCLFYFYPAVIEYRGIFATFMLLLAMIYYTGPGEKAGKVKVLDYIFALFALSIGIYILVNSHRYSFRTPRLNPIFPSDLIFGTVFVLLILEATRRTIGRVLAFIASLALLYPFVAPYIPGKFGHKPIAFSALIEHLFMTTNSIFGIPVGIASTYVIMFVLFGTFFTITGGGDFFFNFATSVTGHTRGGLAKTSVLASALFGTISGSATSNAVTTGAFTIPSMIRAGYPNYFAAAVETAASCGGCILPPVMGAVAFVMAEVIGVPYLKVAIAAVIPALLYFSAVFYGVDLEAVRRGLKGLSKSEIPPIGPILISGIKYIVPIFWLIYRLFRGYTPIRVAGESIIVMLIVGILSRNPKNPITLKIILKGLKVTINAILPVSIACAAAGLIVGVISLTGLGAKLSSSIFALAGNSLFASLFLTMVITLILGMGMNITPTYILAATLAGPALIGAGKVLPMAAHLFIVYFAAIATMTPPVCITAYAAASIAQSDPIKTGYTAVRLGIVAFVIPYVFIYRPEIILAGSSGALLTVMAILIVSIGVFTLAAGINRYLLIKTQWWETVLLLLVSLLMFLPSFISSLIGLVLFGIIVLRQVIVLKNLKVA